jgi:uncharacterized protein YecE (DUF72 family)
VEVQQTFYQPPSLKTAEKWREEAPANFEFALKAWQLITHEPKSPTYRRLKLSWPSDKLARCGSFKACEEVAWAWEQTWKIAAALQAKYVVFQCPASFHPSAENKRNLETFFNKVNRGNLRLIWEPRGPWTRGEVRNLCRELDLIHGVDPFKADPQWGQVRYFRLHGITGYRYRFSGKDLEKLQEKCRGLTYCFFNNVNMWADALAFQDRVQKS